MLICTMQAPGNLLTLNWKFKFFQSFVSQCNYYVAAEPPVRTNEPLQSLFNSIKGLRLHRLLLNLLLSLILIPTAYSSFFPHHPPAHQFSSGTSYGSVPAPMWYTSTKSGEIKLYFSSATSSQFLFWSIVFPLSTNHKTRPHCSLISFSHIATSIFH